MLVIVIDLDNSSNLHLSVEFARYYGMDLNRVIEMYWSADGSRTIN